MYLGAALGGRNWAKNRLHEKWVESRKIACVPGCEKSARRSGFGAMWGCCMYLGAPLWGGHSTSDIPAVSARAHGGAAESTSRGEAPAALLWCAALPVVVFPRHHCAMHLPRRCISAVVTTCGGMFSNFAPHRPKAGWGRRMPGGSSDYVLKLCSPPARGRLGPPWTGRPHRFMPVVNEFDDIEPVGARGAEDPTGFMPVVNQFDDIKPPEAAVNRKTPPVLCRW